MLVLALSLFFTHPVPLDMPRAEAYLVEEDGKLRLDDRYDVFDLWIARAVLGRWEDDDGRRFVLSRLDVKPPFSGSERTLTRVAYENSREELGVKDDLLPSIGLLAPDGLSEKPRPPRQGARGLKEVLYWQHPTNLAAIVCTFLPEKSRHWYLAVWELAEGDGFAERMETFERLFLDEVRTGRGFPPPVAERLLRDERKERRAKRRRLRLPDERELLRADARHSITNYADWHFTDAPEFAVLDDLPSNGTFIPALTNDLRIMRAKYAAAVPSPVDGTNVLCVARIFATRDEYLDAVDEDMAWSAACWCPQRREVIACLPQGGEGDLLRTIRHEAFHQYLSYASSMIAASPWLNEGYAQYFEDTEKEDWGYGSDVTPEWIERNSACIRGILGMDYRQFYEGSDEVRRLKYRIAWSLAYFLEKGAPEVRFRPFRNLKRDYMDELLRSHDMRKATSAAFRSEDNLRLFISEWVKFWKTR